MSNTQFWAIWLVTIALTTVGIVLMLSNLIPTG